MKSMHCGTALCLALIAGGCSTDLRTGSLVRLSPSAESPTPLQSGFVYYLPAAVVTPSASIRVAGCPEDTDAVEKLKPYNVTPKGKQLPTPIKEVQFAVSADVAVEQVQGLPVRIDYRELGDFLKTTNFTMERQPNGMLKTVGVTIEDETPAVLANGAVIAASVALIATGAPTPGIVGLTGTLASGAQARLASSVTQVHYIACKPETVELLLKRAAAAKQKASDTQDLEQTNAALAKLLRNTEPGLAPDEVKLVHQYRDRIIDLTAALEDDGETLKGLDGKLSVKLSAADGADPVAVTTAGNVLPLQVAPDVLEAFIREHFQEASASAELDDEAWFKARTCRKDFGGTCDSVQAVLAVAKPISTVNLSAMPMRRPGNGFTPTFDNPLSGQKHRVGPVRPTDGIIYVEPAIYTFSMKQMAFPSSKVQPEITLKAVKASVPQMGNYLALPVHAGFGEKVALAATFNPDGSLLTASYGRPTSSGKAISGSLAGLAEKYVATKDAIQERKLKLLKGQADLLTAQKAVLDAGNALKDDPLADIKAQIAMVTAQATLAEANLRLRDANAKMGQ